MELKVYVSESGKQLYATDGEGPEGGIAVDATPEYFDQIWLFPGWSRSLFKASEVENAWRDAEMPKAQQNVTAIEYGEEGTPGTAQQWRKYWLDLRKWTDTNPDFPDSAKRPVVPS